MVRSGVDGGGGGGPEDVTVIVVTLELTLPEGRRFTTTMVIAPGVAVMFAGIVATICTFVTETIARGVPFARGTALLNPVPVIVMV